MNTLRIKTLGGLSIQLNGNAVSGFASRKAEALLVYLACNPRAHPREVLAELLWDERTQQRAMANLRVVLSSLRKEVGSYVTITRTTVAINVQADLWLDAAKLETAAAVREQGRIVSEPSAKALAEALALYDGDFLAGFFMPEAAGFETWATGERERLHRLCLDALQRLGRWHLQQGEYGAANAVATRQVQIDALAEAGHRQLMEALARNGQRAEALVQYETCRQLLDEQLDMAPAARTTELCERILAGDLDFDTFQQRGVRGYELKEQIGEGAYGRIHRAIQIAIGREVAVKVIRRQYADDPDFIRRFEVEAQIVANLEHPHIVHLYDYWRDPQGAYLVMRYMRHGSLLSALKSGPWDLRRAASLLNQVADALSVAHQKGIVHRDIKPANILLDELGNAYLADFGIAIDFGRQERRMVDNAVLGTVDYASPEQITNEAVTPRSDIYSLGAMLYETLTGERPFGDGTIRNLLHNHLNTPLPRVAATRHDVPAAIDTVLQKATAKKPAERYATVLEMADAFTRAVGGPVLEWPREEIGPASPIPEVAEIYNPYKGLRPFQEADADDFFGRDDLIQQLLDRLGTRTDGEENRFLAIVGPSGSGKSSAVKAGLIPALRQGALPGSKSWFVAEMVPGTHPLEELEVALWPVAVDPPPSLVEPMQRDTRGLLRTLRRILPADDGSNPQLLLVIDQFEELFTLVEDEERRAFFLDSLLTALKAPRSPLRVVVTLRADFYDRPLQHREWGRLLKENTEIVLPLNHSELTWAVQEPARRMGIRLEEGLVTTIVGDVADQMGALPLLQYALTELFERREGNFISRAAYGDIGGVQGALGRRAEALYAGLNERGREATHQLFLRLVTLGEGIEDTRRRVLRSEVTGLAGVEQPVAVVLDRFGKARLLTFDRDPLSRAPTVEVAHEALLREWPRLRRWLNQSRDDVRLQRLLGQASREWALAGMDDAYLLRGSRLDQFGSWVEESKLALNQDEMDFLSASLYARKIRRDEADARRQRELQTARQLAATEKARADEQAQATVRLRRLAVGLAIVFLVAVVAALFALDRGREAQSSADAAATSAAAAVAEADQRATAEASAVEQARLATSRELSLAALNTLDTDPELSILLALEALETAYTKDAEEALHRALQTSRVLMSFTSTEPKVDWVSFTPDGQRLLMYGEVRDLKTGEQLLALPPGDMLYSEDGPTIAVLGGSEEVGSPLTFGTWDALSGTPMVSRTLPFTTETMGGVWLSPDWSLLSARYEGGSTVLWDMETGEAVVSTTGEDLPVARTGFNEDGTRLLLAGRNGDVTILDVPASVASGRPVPAASFTSGAATGVGGDFTFSKDGGHVALAVDATRVELWALSTPPQLQLVLSSSQTNLIQRLAFSPNRSLLAAASLDGTVEVWETDEGRTLYTLAGHTGGVRRLAFSPDGRMLATGSLDGTARIWNAAPVGGGEVAEFATGRAIMSIKLSPDGQTLALGSIAGPAILVDATTGERLLELAGEAETGVYQVAFHPDGHRVATVGQDNVIRIWDGDTGELLRAWIGHREGISGGLFFGTIDVDFSPDGGRLATAGTDGVAKVWDTESGAEVLVLEGHTDGLFSIAYSPDGRWIATSSDENDSTVKIWDATTGLEVYSLEGHPVRVMALAFSPDSRLLATGGSQGVVKVWDVATGEEQYTLPSQVDTVTTIRFTADGTKMVTNGAALRVWDVATGSELLTLGDNAQFALTPDGRHLYAADRNQSEGVVRVYLLSLEDSMALARERLTRWWRVEECQQYLHRDKCPEE